jgi:hypothetical protein
MSIDNDLYLDTPASCHALRDVLVQANIGLDEDADYKNSSGRTVSGAVGASTGVTIHGDLSWRSGQLDNGVIPTRLVTFHFRRKGSGKDEHWDEYDMQTVRGVVALLKAFPDADAFWVALDAEDPTLLRRGGQLVLAQHRARPGSLWDPARQPSCVAMVDLPYTVASLGPWNLIDK